MSDDEPILPTQTSADLNPPPIKPPTAIGAEASEPESRPPRPGRPGSNALMRAIDSALDALDKLGDMIRSATKAV
jgi:hypothetical protein